MNKNRDGLTILLVVIIALLTINTIFGILSYAKLNDSNTNNESSNGETDSEYDVSAFKALNQTEFLKAVESDDLQVTYFGRSGCSYCIQFVPIMNQAISEGKVEHNYVDIAENVDTTSEDYIKMTTLINDYLAANFDEEGLSYGVTPMCIATKKGKIVDVWVGYTDYNSYTEWLEKAGF